MAKPLFPNVLWQKILMRILISLLLLAQLVQSQPIDGVLQALRMTFWDVGEAIAEEPQDLQIIGAGLCRTGTSSLYKALESLNYKTYHMFKVFESQEHSAVWASTANGEMTPEQLFEFLRQRGYNATLDYPAIDYLQVQHRLYPQAKVILTIRDTPLTWVNSYRTLRRMEDMLEIPFSLYNPFWPNPLSLFFPTKFQQMHDMRCYIGVGSLGLKPCEAMTTAQKDDDWHAEQYEQYLTKVKNMIPAEQLLVFNVKQGWKPLCKFLGIEESQCPKEPFPHAGKSQFLQQLIRIGLVILYGWIPCLLLALYWTARKVQQKLMRGTTTKEKDH